jgi:hypothetical protein
MGLDVGFSAVKAVTERYQTLFPSVIGTPVATSTYSLNELHDENYIIREGKELIPLGWTALRQSTHTTGRRNAEWVGSNDWLTLFLGACGNVVRTPVSRIGLVTGLPLSDWNVLAEDLYKLLLHQEFEIIPGGEVTRRVTVENMLVVTQPYGTLSNYCLKSDGSISSGMPCNRVAGVIDIGGNTLNLLAAEAMNEIPRWTSSSEFGLLHMLDIVRDRMRAELPRFYPQTHEVSEWLAKGTFRYHGEDKEIKPYAEEYLNSLLEVLISRIREAWPQSARFDAVLVTGGGAELFGPQLVARLEDFANVFVVDNPRWANVRGYYKLAERQFGDA